MQHHYHGERWKPIQFPAGYSNQNRIEISNYGRLRSFNAISDGDILKGSMINGYRIIRLKLYKPRAAEVQQKMDKLQQQALRLARKIKKLRAEKAGKSVIAEVQKKLGEVKASISLLSKYDLKSRVHNYHALVHRLVADYFLRKPGRTQTVVGHLNHDKLNNYVHNLKWMTPHENYEHAQCSPLVIKDKAERRNRRNHHSKNIKLSVTKVMLIKKLLGEGKPVKQLARQFKVSNMQIYRIKWGENWGDVPAAK